MMKKQPKSCSTSDESIANDRALYQFTIGSSHSFVPKRIQASAEVLGWGKGTRAFAFVVPRRVFDAFTYDEGVSIGKGGSMKSSKRVDTHSRYPKMNHRGWMSL